MGLFGLGRRKDQGKDLDAQTRAVLERHERDLASGMVGQGLIYHAGTLAENGRAEEGLALLDRVARDLTEKGYEGHRDEWETWWATRTDVLLALERFDDAVAACREKVGIAKRNQSYSDYWETHAYLADLLQYKTKNLAAALVERRELWDYFRGRIAELAKDGAELAYNAVHVHVPNGVKLAWCCREAGRWEEALAVYRDLVGDVVMSTFLGKDAVEVPTLLMLAAETQASSGDEEAAKRTAEEGLKKLDALGPGNGEIRGRLEALVKGRV